MDAVHIDNDELNKLNTLSDHFSPYILFLKIKLLGIENGIGKIELNLSLLRRAKKERKYRHYSQGKPRFRQVGWG